MWNNRFWYFIMYVGTEKYFNCFPNMLPCFLVFVWKNSKDWQLAYFTRYRYIYKLTRLIIFSIKKSDISYLNVRLTDTHRANSSFCTCCCWCCSWCCCCCWFCNSSTELYRERTIYIYPMRQAINICFVKYFPPSCGIILANYYALYGLFQIR